MTSTPPPPRRIHTPPTPLHGPKYDNYEPYSPRRSSRVAAQHSKATPSPLSSSSLKASVRVCTPPPTFRITKARRTNQTFSPPSSPSSPFIDASIASPKGSHKRVRLSQQDRASPIPASDSDTDILPEKELHRRTSSKDSLGMLNTPAKTPRKRKDVQLNSTARLLFGDNEGLLEPTPRRARKSILDPFGLLDDDVVASSSKIEIYTDSKDRVPSMDHDESNPFLSQNAAKTGGRSKTRRTNSKESRMDDLMRNEEGMVYVFRGKKVFRKFEDATTPEADADDGDDNLSDIDIRRKAGTSATKPFLRSSIKPRLLFPSEEQRRAREEAEEADEEALTDIEMPKPAIQQVRTVTPTKPHFTQVITPPTSVKVKRIPKDETPAVDEAELQSQNSAASTHGRKKRSPFDAYQRKKVAAAVTSKGTKREGSPSLQDSASKRTRSTTTG